jgi:hypothetical protein
MIFDHEDVPDYDAWKPTWWGVAAVGLAMVVLATSLAYAIP